MLASDLTLPAREDHTTLNHSDVLTVLSTVPDRLVVEDTDLFEVKWWDYRYMTPLQATLAYADAFGVEFRRAYQRELDHERGQHVSTVSGARMLERLQALTNAHSAVEVEMARRSRATFTALWRGRQVADALGMPYDLFIGEAMAQRLRYWKGSYLNPRTGRWSKTTLPGPDKLYLDWIIEKVAARWEEMKEARIWFAEHDAYHPRNHADLPWQNAYFNELLARSMQWPDFTDRVVDLIRSDRLPYDFAEAQLGEKFERVQKALS